MTMRLAARRVRLEAEPNLLIASFRMLDIPLKEDAQKETPELLTPAAGCRRPTMSP